MFTPEAYPRNALCSMTNFQPDEICTQERKKKKHDRIPRISQLCHKVPAKLPPTHVARNTARRLLLCKQSREHINPPFHTHKATPANPSRAVHWFFPLCYPRTVALKMRSDLQGECRRECEKGSVTVTKSRERDRKRKKELESMQESTAERERRTKSESDCSSRGHDCSSSSEH